MKKIMSIVLTAVILIMSVLSVSAFAQEQTKAEKWIQNNKTQNPELEIVCNSSENEGVSSVAEFYMKEGKFACIQAFPITEHVNLNVKVLVIDGTVYMLLPSFPYIHLKIENLQVDLPSFDEIFPYENMIYVKSGEITEGQITYYTEEYVYENGEKIIYYFNGEELIKTETYYDDGYDCSLYLCNEIISREVDDSVFEIPWYSINISPFIDFMFDSNLFISL